MQHHLPRAPFFFEEMQKDINVALKINLDYIVGHFLKLFLQIFHVLKCPWNWIKFNIKRYNFHNVLFMSTIKPVSVSANELLIYYYFIYTFTRTYKPWIGNSLLKL